MAWCSRSSFGRRLNGRFQLIAGERRWHASKLAGKKTIPAILRQVSDEQAMEITIVENLQRADLNPMEQARAFERLSREFHMTQEQMAHANWQGSRFCLQLYALVEVTGNNPDLLWSPAR